MKSLQVVALICALLSLSTAFISVEKSKKFLKKFEKHQKTELTLGDEFQGTYQVSNAFTQGNKYVGDLTYEGNLNTFMSSTNKVIKSAKYVITLNSNEEVTLKVYPNETFFEMPYNEPFPYEKNTNEKTDNLRYQVTAPTNGQRFQFVLKSLTGRIIFDTNTMPFVLTEQYVQFGTTVSDETVWGWGERRSQWAYESGQYTIWNYDNPVEASTGHVASQTYGTHPMVLQMSNVDGQAEYHITYLRTLYGLELDYRKNQDFIVQMNGGPIELKYFVYDTPKANLEAYHRYINGWAVVPFWSLGFQLSRWGLKNSQEWADVVQQSVTNNVPLDVMWSDIDYLQDYNDFTISTEYDTTVMKKVTDLSDPNGVRWVPIIDAGVAVASDSGKEGLHRKAYIDSHARDGALIGCVWPGAAYFMDWNHPNSTDFWIDGLENITTVYNGPQPSGIWLDMNEPSSFTNGAGEVINPDDCSNQSILSQSQQSSDWAYPWSPMGNLPLQYKTISTNATHYNKENAPYFFIEDFTISEYEFHNLYGFLEGIPTRKYLKKQGFALPFIISRSTAAGYGAIGQHWTGDNSAEWDQLITSIADIFNFQLFGIPMTGADVCGFSGNTTPELCARWYQAGAWYPFYRSHNDNTSINQWPWSFPQDPYVLSSSRAAINLRYSIMKWYYSVFLREQPHGSIFKPLFFEYPQDTNCQVEAHQALIGEEIMIAPVLLQGDSNSLTTDIKVYFPGPPGTKWWSMTPSTNSTKQYLNNQSVQAFTIPFDEVAPWWLKSGSIIVSQFENTELRSRSLNNEYELIVALDQALGARGTFASVADFDESNVNKQCLEKGNCLLDLSAQQVEIAGKEYLQLYALPKNSDTNYDATLQIKSVQVLGKGTYSVDSKFGVNNQVIMVQL